MYQVFLFLNLDLGLQLALRHTIYVFKLTISKKRTITRPNKWSKWRLFKFLGTNKKVEFVIFPFFSCIYLLTRQFFVVKTFFFFSWKLDKANSRFVNDMGNFVCSDSSYDVENLLVFKVVRIFFFMFVCFNDF